ncbi:hypothetical protein LK996_06225 [Lysobacter sp. A6]|uniref:DUF2721 domain-containing protein n=1 Tax=Noviluteimonas lactosilytica TaxID=2888523 RepID=A0ABS8JGE6_9GAMM|nr:hypothetical protein [Lysobacter lactosilyticus]MCC8362669.1 hypothetical protein [Lysobacter lactosilyticus]
MNPNDLFVPLSFIGGPAILMNACAVMQNGASVRYSLAINLWREMRAEASGGTGTLLRSYSDPALAMTLASRRIRLLLVSLNLLYVTVAMFGIATVCGLAGSYVYIDAETGIATWAVRLVVGAATLATTGLLAAMCVFVVESRTTQRLIHLQAHVADR